MSYTNHTVIAGKTTDHAVHLILTIITCGMWAPVWALFAILGAFKKTRVVSAMGVNPVPVYGNNQGDVISPDGHYVWNAQAQEWRLR